MDNLDRIIQLFPEHSQEIEHCYSNSDVFQEICRDYAEAHQACVHWSQIEGEKANKCADEYKNLLSKLEIEIQQMLDEVNPKGEI